jgi:hypothetical protein
LSLLIASIEEMQIGKFINSPFMVNIFGITMASFSCHVFLAVTEPGYLYFSK